MKKVEQDKAIGKHYAGHTTKIHLAFYSIGKPIEFSITGDRVNDCTAAPDLIGTLPK